MKLLLMFWERIQKKLDEITDRLHVIAKETRIMSKAIEDLTAQVAANTTVLEGAATLIAGLRQQIIDAGTDAVALQALTDSLAASDAKLSEAIVANTTQPAVPPDATP